MEEALDLSSDRILNDDDNGDDKVYFSEFYVHGTVHLSNTSFIKYQRDATFSVYLVYYNSTCFGHSLRPSSGVIYKV